MREPWCGVAVEFKNKTESTNPNEETETTWKRSATLLSATLAILPSARLLYATLLSGILGYSR